MTAQIATMLAKTNAYFITLLYSIRLLFSNCKRIIKSLILDNKLADKALGVRVQRHKHKQSFKLHSSGVYRLGVIFALLLVVSNIVLSLVSQLLPQSASALDPAVDPDDPSNFTMNPATDISGCAGQSECFAFTIDTRLDVDGNATVTNKTFAIPTSGRITNAPNAYNWIINWGDGGADQYVSGTSSSTSAGIDYTYMDSGKYRITIRPNGTTTAGWMNAFGFYGADGSGANAAGNQYMFRSINTPFTNLMRTKGESFRFSGVFIGARNAIGIPANLFANISTNGDTDFSYMFHITFQAFAYNATGIAIPAGLFSAINTSQGTNFSNMFRNTFANYAYSSTVGTIPGDLFATIDTRNGTIFYYMFSATFSLYARMSNVTSDLSIPAGLFSAINTSNGTNFSYMFNSTFRYMGVTSTNSARVTIPSGLFDGIRTGNGISFVSMFENTFSPLSGSYGGTIPEDLFKYVDTSKGTSFTNMFNTTFESYARRTANFLVGDTTVLSRIFSTPYATKIGTNGTPSSNPTITAGDHIYPTYNATTRSITAPTDPQYAGYSWYRTDGTSCAAPTPSTNCGPQTTPVTFPITNEWTPTTSTMVGDVTFYGVAPLYINLSLDSTTVDIGNLTPNIGFGSGNNTATVTTNNSTGYTLSISTDLPSSDTHASDMKHATLSRYIAGTSNTCVWNAGSQTLTNTMSALVDNTWGFTLNSGNLAAQQLCRVPDADSPLIIKSTSVADEAGDQTVINYGAKINMSTAPGLYSSTVIYTATANP